MTQLVGRYDPLFVFRQISVDPDKILPKEIAGKSLGMCQVIVNADLNMHGAQELERLPGPVIPDQPGRLPIDI